jgi:hypothetical protein
MAVGILALPAAIAVASGTKSGRAAGVAWNLLGIADAVLAMTLGALTAPGPLQLQALAPDHPNVLVGACPVALTPAFVVPLSLIFHDLWLRQLRRQAARGTQECDAFCCRTSHAVRRVTISPNASMGTRHATDRR